MPSVARQRVGPDRHGLAGTLAALDFAKRVVARRGRVTREDAAILRTAGFSDREISEIVSAVTSGFATPAR